jgi:hypothetical protein
LGDTRGVRAELLTSTCPCPLPVFVEWAY